jgi:putative SOS response-associated peptidase YedK
MPVILNSTDYDLWLDPAMENVAAISDLLKPYDARLMRCYPVSTRINHVANDDEERSRQVEMSEAHDCFPTNESSIWPSTFSLYFSLLM